MKEVLTGVAGVRLVPPPWRRLYLTPATAPLIEKDCVFDSSVAIECRSA